MNIDWNAVQAGAEAEKKEREQAAAKRAEEMRAAHEAKKQKTQELLDHLGERIMEEKRAELEEKKRQEEEKAMNEIRKSYEKDHSNLFESENEKALRDWLKDPKPRPADQYSDTKVKYYRNK